MPKPRQPLPRPKLKSGDAAAVAERKGWWTYYRWNGSSGEWVEAEPNAPGATLDLNRALAFIATRKDWGPCAMSPPA